MHVLPPLWRKNGNHYILQTVGQCELASQLRPTTPGRPAVCSPCRGGSQGWGQGGPPSAPRLSRVSVHSGKLNEKASGKAVLPPDLGNKAYCVESRGRELTLIILLCLVSVWWLAPNSAKWMHFVLGQGLRLDAEWDAIIPVLFPMLDDATVSHTTTKRGCWF